MESPITHMNWKQHKSSLQQNTGDMQPKKINKNNQTLCSLLYGIMITALPMAVDKSINPAFLWGPQIKPAHCDHRKKASLAINNALHKILSLMPVARKKQHSELLLKNDNSQQRGDHIFCPSIRGLGCSQKVVWWPPGTEAQRSAPAPLTLHTSGCISLSSGDQCAFIALLPLSEAHGPLPLAPGSIYLLLYLQ